MLPTRKLIDYHTGQFVSVVVDDIRWEFNKHNKIAGLPTYNAGNMKRREVYRQVSHAVMQQSLAWFT